MTTTTQKELDDCRKDLKVALADVQTAKARLSQAQLNLSYTVIRSPLTGVIGKANKDVGSYLNPQTDGPLATVQQMDPLYVEFPITERDLLRLARVADAGRKTEFAVQLTLPDGKIYPHPGKVDFVDIRVEPKTGTAMIRAKLDNPDGVLRPGQLLRVKVTGLERKNVLTVLRGRSSSRRPEPSFSSWAPKTWSSRRPSLLATGRLTAGSSSKGSPLAPA